MGKTILDLSLKSSLDRGWHFEFWDDHASMEPQKLRPKCKCCKMLKKTWWSWWSHHFAHLSPMRSRTDGWEVSEAPAAIRPNVGIPRIRMLECRQQNLVRSGIKRADIARLVALSVYGGVFRPQHLLVPSRYVVQEILFVSNLSKIYSEKLMPAVWLFSANLISWYFMLCSKIYGLSQNLQNSSSFWSNRPLKQKLGDQKIYAKNPSKIFRLPWVFSAKNSQVYADIDVEATRSLEPLLLAAEETDAAVLLGHVRRVFTASGTPIVLDVVLKCNVKVDSLKVWNLAGEENFVHSVLLDWGCSTRHAAGW